MCRHIEQIREGCEICASCGLRLLFGPQGQERVPPRRRRQRMRLKSPPISKKQIRAKSP